MSVMCSLHVRQAGQVAGAPALLVLDEVDAALDEMNQRLVASLLKVCRSVASSAGSLDEYDVSYTLLHIQHAVAFSQKSVACTLHPATLMPASAGSPRCLVTLKAFLAPQAMAGTRSDKAQVICVTHHSEFEALCNATIMVSGSMLTRFTG
jgi:hypothetical protein